MTLTHRWFRVRALVRVAIVAVILAPFAWAITPAGAAEPLDSFVRSYGDPPRATEGRLRIPSIGVDAPIGAQRVAANGDSPMPLGPSDVAWYDFGPFAGLGGEPGRGQNAVYSGHVDYVARVPWAGVRYGGPAVFARLGEVRVGDTVEVVRNGEALTYTVAWTLKVDAERAQWGEYWNASVLVDSITLYTCAGDFDSSSISYSDRVIVRAERLVGTPRELPQTNGDYTAGVSGTNAPGLLAKAQPFPVRAIWKLDPATGGYLFWAPNVPVFLNTLNGRLAPDDYVIMKIRD
jgi:sortase (surface protein transpeptidase)